MKKKYIIYTFASVCLMMLQEYRLSAGDATHKDKIVIEKAEKLAGQMIGITYDTESPAEIMMYLARRVKTLSSGSHAHRHHTRKRSRRSKKSSLSSETSIYTGSDLKEEHYASVRAKRIAAPLLPSEISSSLGTKRSRSTKKEETIDKSRSSPFSTPCTPHPIERDMPSGISIQSEPATTESDEDIPFVPTQSTE